jgi:hypothetical protein
MSCSTEYYSFIQRRLATVSTELDQMSQTEELKRVGLDADGHMRMFVAQRDN